MKLQIYKTDPTFNLKKDFLSAQFQKFETIINEFTGLKEKVIYKDIFDKIVAEKTYKIIPTKDGLSFKEKITIVYFDDKGNKVESSKFSKEDYHNKDKQLKVVRSCVKQVYSKLLNDIEEEIELKLIQADREQEAIDEITLFKQGINNLFQDVLKEEVRTLLDRGDAKPLYDAVTSIESNLLEAVADTGNGLTYKQILLEKFNPNNFNFYHIINIDDV